MKVIVAHNRYRSGIPSGENAVVDADIAQLREAGVEVVAFERESDAIGALPVTQRVLLPVSPLYNGAAQRDLARVLVRERPDVLHLHNPYPLLSPAVVRTAHRHGVPVVQTVHNYRHVCAAGTFFRDGHPCHDCQGRSYPLPAIRHGCYRESRAQSVIMASALAAHRSTWRSVQRYLTLSAGMAEHLRSIGITEEQITVKPNAVPDPGPHEVPGSGFLYAGRLVPEKGVALILAAWARHPVGALGELRVAGDGPLREPVLALAAERPDVTYLGSLSPQDTAAAMRAAAVVLATPLWEEPFGLTVVEALANARPVLVTDRGAPAELIGVGGPEPAGWVVAAELEALVRALPVAYRGSAAFRHRARQRYLEHFAPQPVTERLIGIYREVTASGVAAAGT